MAAWSMFVNHGPCYVGLDASTRRDLTEIAANIKQAEEMGTFRSIDLLLGCVFSSCTHIALHDPFFKDTDSFITLQSPNRSHLFFCCIRHSSLDCRLFSLSQG